jgi:4-amino-4-deoxy-L-arabinose transferase-like glycosyltransferase
MNFFKKNKKKILILLTIFVVALLPRIWSLGSVPISLSDDEVRQGYEAYSFFKFGRGAYGEFLPLGFKIDGFVYGPISIYISSLFFWLFKLDALSVRLPYAICGTFSVLFIYQIARKISNSSIVGILTALTVSFSVWSIQVSRLAHDVAFSFLFYLIGTYLFLIAKKKGILPIILSAMFFSLGFYSYAATKVIFIPILLILSWYRFKDLRKKQLWIFWIILIFDFIFFLFLAKTQGLSQYNGGQFFFQDTVSTSLSVELERRASFEPAFIENIFHNKITYWTGVFLNNYLYAFSPNYLFLSQEASGIYSIWGRGMLYMIELPFLILGFCWMLLKNKKTLVFILLMLLISPLPSAIGVSRPTYLTRSVFMIPWLYILIGIGIYAVSQIIKNRKIKYLAYCLIILVYVYSISNYFSQYYYDWKYYGAKYYSKSTKDLVLLINKEKNKRTKIIIGGASHNTFLHYALYNRLNPQDVARSLRNNPVVYQNIVFSESCLGDKADNPRSLMKNNSIYVASVSCNKKIKENSVIKAYDDSEVIWKIYLK